MEQPAPLWHLYNLRESPFFQDQLAATEDARYPIELFVGRDAEVGRLCEGIRQQVAASSRQTVQAPPGFGKSTLVQRVKGEVAGDGILSHANAVSIGHADTAQTVQLRIVSYVYAAILGAAQTSAIADVDAMTTARQLTLAFQARAGGAGFSLAGVGANVAVNTQYVTPTAALEVLVPQLLRDLIDVARERLDARGVLVHIDNLENLTEQDDAKAAAVIRDLRDTVLLSSGYHFLLVGTDAAIRTAVAAQQQVRDVFMLPRPIAALSLEQIHELLHKRYEYLRVDARTPVLAPVSEDALEYLHGLFGGNLRGLFAALQHASVALIEFGLSGARPMTLADVRTVLRGRFEESIEATLEPAMARHLRALASQVAPGAFTRRDARDALDVTEGMVTTVLQELMRLGYVHALPPAPARGRGQPQKMYALGAAAVLAFASGTH